MGLGSICDARRRARFHGLLSEPLSLQVQSASVEEQQYWKRHRQVHPPPMRGEPSSPYQMRGASSLQRLRGALWLSPYQMRGASLPSPYETRGASLPEWKRHRQVHPPPMRGEPSPPYQMRGASSLQCQRGASFPSPYSTRGASLPQRQRGARWPQLLPFSIRGEPSPCQTHGASSLQCHRGALLSPSFPCRVPSFQLRSVWPSQLLSMSPSSQFLQTSPLPPSPLRCSSSPEPPQSQILSHLLSPLSPPLSPPQARARLRFRMPSDLLHQHPPPPPPSPLPLEQPPRHQALGLGSEDRKVRSLLLLAEKHRSLALAQPIQQIWQCFGAQVQEDRQELLHS